VKAKPAAFLRTTLPIDFSVLPEMDTDRFHSLWLPDHMVSFWPDSIWTPEFTDLATVNPSPHRQLDSLAVAGLVAGRTEHIPIATSVVDTVRRHPTLLAQTALTLSHLSKGRFILGVGSGETENIVPYGFDFRKSVSRFEEALKVIRLLFERTGPFDFEGEFYKLHHARLDTEPFEGRPPPIWAGAGGPRMLDITGRLADGWWSLAIYSPEEYAAKLAIVHGAAERAGRDPAKIETAFFWSCVMGDEAELAEIFESKLIKAYFLLQVTGERFAKMGYQHPMGDAWRGYQDNDPSVLTREVILKMVEKVPGEAIRKLVPHGSPEQVARTLVPYVEAGVQVYRIHDMGGLAGLKHAGRTAAKIRAAEDELTRLLEAKG
jgi:phthiodiolone/phenolphthiodiolone dimycocerosates ketoreductase